ncbi:amino acid deaminase [Georgenia halophila]|uniref:Amino acid deaminase n=1 Tax=Georgenia halophila TaxID=620889 RepID=A0ABP8KTK8_9MICO
MSDDSSVPGWREVFSEHLFTPGPLDKNYVAGGFPVDVSGLPTPSFTLDVDAVRDNLGAMQDWTAACGVLLAPHGKTTMAPALWDWQLASGSWGITVANAFQLRVARAFGVPRVLVANELISPDGLAWLAGELADGFDVTCWADSVAGVEQMAAGLRAAGATRPLGVCVELGAADSRTGTRSPGEAREIALAVRGSDVLELRGIAAYEGSIHAAYEGIHAESREELLAQIREFLAMSRRAFTDLADLYEVSEPILTAGGSQYFDLVAEAFDGVAGQVPGALVVLRSGAYFVHDHGHYSAATPAATRHGPAFRGAAHVWARVLSVPEPGLALLDAGKRDVPYDAGLPRVLSVRRGASGEEAKVEAEVVKLNDQHAYVSVTAGTLAVGDVVRLGLSHPCTMFDKWRSVVLVEGDRAVGTIRTYF